MIVWVLQGNLPGIKFYQAIGFTADGGKKMLEITGKSLPEIRLSLSLL